MNSRTDEAAGRKTGIFGTALWKNSMDWWVEQKLISLENCIERHPLLRWWYINILIDRWSITSTWQLLLLLTLSVVVVVTAAVGALIMAVMLLTACEKTIVPENVAANTGRHSVTLRLVTTEDAGQWQRATTRSAQPVAQFLSRVGVAAFTADDTKAATISQKESDADFGTVTLQLSAGSYRLVALAHNCSGSATISSTEKVTFPSNKVTDTFYHYGTLIVDEDGTATVDGEESGAITLERCVARFRLVLTDDELPAELAQMKFYYLGGSSTFSPKAGWGCVQSKQTEIRAVSSDDDRTFDIYTMPHEAGDVLTRLVVTAQDAQGNTLRERIFTEVPVTINETTQYEGNFFGGSGGMSTAGSVLMTDPAWGTTRRYSF